jgi:hypothetical protein
VLKNKILKKSSKKICPDINSKPVSFFLEIVSGFNTGGEDNLKKITVAKFIKLLELLFIWIKIF